MIKRKYPPDFKQLEKVLKRQKPEHPVLFEYFSNADLISQLTGKDFARLNGNSEKIKQIIEFFFITGYDYATIPSRYLDIFTFETGENKKKDTVSLNQGALITDWASFENYPWPEPEKGNYKLLDKTEAFLKDGMKFIVPGPGGLLENVIYLVGYENLCYLIFEDEELTKNVFDAVGTSLFKFYEICSSFPSVGALIVNDDWGFKNQTMLSPDTLRQFVFPWQKKIVETIHQNNKFAILHSCGNIAAVIDDIVKEMKFDAKHSFEDNVIPVEQAWENWNDKIAILGGIDVDFLTRKTPQEIKARSRELLEITGLKAYALGSGNSIPPYVPINNYLAMIEVINEY